MTTRACSYLNLSTLGSSDLGKPKAMVRNGLSGWYDRVLAPDVLTAGDSVTLEPRPHPQSILGQSRHLSRQKITESARQLGLDMARFIADVLRQWHSPGCQRRHARFI